MKKENRLPATQFHLIELEFGDIINGRYETDSTGKPSNNMTVRKTYKLIGGYKLYITEVRSKGFIEFYYYDLYDKNGAVVMKFGSESHEGDPRYQTSTEPFHIHGPLECKLNNIKRIANENYRDLFHIMEFIRLMLIFTKQMPNLHNLK